MRMLDVKIYRIIRSVNNTLSILPKNKIHHILSVFNSYHKRLQFRCEIEKTHSINFLNFGIFKNLFDLAML